jgi:hypothetical protein
MFASILGFALRFGAVCFVSSLLDSLGNDCSALLYNNPSFGKVALTDHL